MQVYFGFTKTKDMNCCCVQTVHEMIVELTLYLALSSFFLTI